MKRSRALPLIVLTLMLGAFTAACGGDDDKPAAASSSATAAPGTSAPRTAAASPSARTAEDPPARFRAFEVPAAITSGAAAGNASAPVTLEMFEDFQCPHCLSFMIGYEQLIFDEYVIPGKVKVQFRHAPILGDESGNAAVAAACAAIQNRFWPYAKALFVVQLDAGQLTKEQLNVGRFTEDSLTAIATKLGLDIPAFTACLHAPATIEAVNADIRAGTTLGVRGTPSFSVNGRLVATPGDAAAWRRLLDAAVSGVR